MLYKKFLLFYIQLTMVKFSNHFLDFFTICHVYTPFCRTGGIHALSHLLSVTLLEYHNPFFFSTRIAIFFQKGVDFKK